MCFSDNYVVANQICNVRLGNSFSDKRKESKTFLFFGPTGPAEAEAEAGFLTC